MIFMTESTRLDTIEIKLAHLERSLQELGQVVMRQRREIEALSTLNRTLQAQVETFAGSSESSGPGSERPPHY